MFVHICRTRVCMCMQYTGVRVCVCAHMPHTGVCMCMQYTGVCVCAHMPHTGVCMCMQYTGVCVCVHMQQTCMCVCLCTYAAHRCVYVYTQVCVCVYMQHTGVCMYAGSMCVCVCVCCVNILVLQSGTWCGKMSSLQGCPKPYIYSVYDRVFGDFPAKYNVVTYIHRMYMVLANPTSFIGTEGVGLLLGVWRGASAWRIQVLVMYHLNPTHLRSRVGQNHGEYTVFMAENSPNMRSCTVYVYGSGQP